MTENYRNIDDLFRDKFEKFEMDPPEHVWQNVKAGISGNNGGISGNRFDGQLCNFYGRYFSFGKVWCI